MASEKAFNGGKLTHPFATKRVGKWQLTYTEDFTSPEAREALEKGVKLLKVDGACTVLHKESDEKGTWSWRFCQRQDNYKGEESTLDLPEGKQPAHYSQGGKEHNYCWLPVDPKWVCGKGKRKQFPGPDTYQTISKAVEDGNLPDPSDPEAPEWITCEWVGIKHQKNMDGIPYDHALVLHQESFVSRIEGVSSLADFVELAKRECFEGIVIVAEDGTRFKMRCDMVEGSLWNKFWKKKPTDPGVTTISPQVLCKDGLLRRGEDGSWALVES